MNWVSGALIFLIIWWTVIFIVLPWGIERDQRGIPIKAHMKKKLVMTTSISVILWLVVYAMIQFGIIDFRTMSETMMKQDYGHENI
jgi:predicted secreted protein